jgi:hypothetical protein
VAIWSRFVMLPLGALLFIVLWVTANHRSVAATSMIVLVSVVAFSNATFIWAAPILARRAASAALGVKITGKNYPPNDPSSYLRWCQENGIKPNCAGSR